MSTTLSWTTNAKLDSVVYVGLAVVAMHCEMGIYFTNLRTREKSFYKADSAATGAGISLMTGHFRMPIYAFAEAVLRPHLFVMKYPENTKMAIFDSPYYCNYVDIRFSDYDILIALTGYPFYAFRILNFRTKQLLIEYQTHLKCSRYSILCSSGSNPTIAQYSGSQKEIYVWQLSLQPEKVDFNKMSAVSIPHDFRMSSTFGFVYSDDNIYLVNDYGAVFLFDMGCFCLKNQWTPDDAPSEPQPHKIFYQKQGVVVANRESVRYIRRKTPNWTVQWTIDCKQIEIVKVVTNFINEVYLINARGHIHRVDSSQDSTDLYRICIAFCVVKKIVVLRGVREEAILMLTDTGELRLVDALRMYTYSSKIIDGASSMNCHSSYPFVAVGTIEGAIHFLSYEKIRTPEVVAIIETENCPIVNLMFGETSCLAQNEEDTFFGIHSDVVQGEYLLTAPVRNDRQDRRIIKYFLVGENIAFSFVTKEMEQHVPYATELHLIYWMMAEKKYRRIEFNLPYRYGDFAVPPMTNKKSIEFYGVRVDDVVIDVFTLNNFKKLILETTIKTTHCSKIIGISGGKNLITWGVDGTQYHFRTHRRGRGAYAIARTILTVFEPVVIKMVTDCFNGKYVIHLYSDGTAKCIKVTTGSEGLRENKITTDVGLLKNFTRMKTQSIFQKVEEVVVEITEEDMAKRSALEKDVAEVAVAVQELIDYDMSVTGRTEGIFRKFCLNRRWLEILTNESRLLCEAERNSLMAAIDDQSRIRDWILNLISSTAKTFSYKLRGLFANIHFDNYSVRQDFDEILREFDMFRFYDMERPVDDEGRDDNGSADERSSELDEVGDGEDQGDDGNNEGDDGEGDGGGDGDGEGGRKVKKRKTIAKKNLKLFKIIGNVYDHVMADQFRIQDKDITTAYEMFNNYTKLRIVLNDALRFEFNKKFMELRAFKQESIDSILRTNQELTKIYANMNCMLCLLGMERFEPPELSVPEWTKDEVLERIMTVDDSEIKAINRRAKKKDMEDVKHGRLLLWALEFWERALQIMMDGVIEKLWEEEIKKDVPKPEFMLKKQDHEYTLEDQKLLREYEAKVEALQADRRKYLGMLHDKDRKTSESKRSYILKLNEKCTVMSIEKLKYDFALRQYRLRMCNEVLMNVHRIGCRERIKKMSTSIQDTNEYLSKYSSLVEFFEKTSVEMKSKLDQATLRDRVLERQFKSQFLAALPVNFVYELGRLYRRRPKLLAKSFTSPIVCSEVANRMLQKAQRSAFPLSVEAVEYLNNLEELDDPKNAPNQLDPKYWDQFVRLRRTKLESELRVKAINGTYMDAQGMISKLLKDLDNVKTFRDNSLGDYNRLIEEYMDLIINRKLQITLPMGQVEVRSRGSYQYLSGSVLMNIDDVHNVNNMIKEAGEIKLKSMQKVAFFRRQVIFKEWEHRVTRANIDYLNYILQVVSKCKVTMEFLTILRNWERVKEESKVMTSSLGYIEHIIERKLASYRKDLDRILDKIDATKVLIEEMKYKNHKINRDIDEIKADIVMDESKRDTLLEEKRTREHHEKMRKIKIHANLINTVRSDYVRILELSTILELQRLRTYPTLGPPPPCDKDLKPFVV